SVAVDRPFSSTLVKVPEPSFKAEETVPPSFTSAETDVRSPPSKVAVPAIAKCFRCESQPPKRKANGPEGEDEKTESSWIRRKPEPRVPVPVESSNSITWASEIVEVVKSRAEIERRKSALPEAVFNVIQPCPSTSN